MPVHPISFSIPEQKIVSEVPVKLKQYAHIVPGDLSTYIFDDEQSYYNDYQTSLFGYTWKKGGWDCLRHYEILANGCIPWFQDLDQCPPTTMTHFPKKLVLEAMASDRPDEYIPDLLSYTREHLTCRAMAQYLLTTIGHPNPTSVLFLSEEPRPDYQRCLTLIGLKQLLGSRCREDLVPSHIYDDAQNTHSLYGKGFTYTKILPAELKPNPTDILSTIQSHDYDCIIYGSCHRGLPYWDIVSKVYSPNDIAIVCGEDTCSACPMVPDVHSFVREL